jgi:hypothetical protein
LSRASIKKETVARPRIIEAAIESIRAAPQAVGSSH